MSLPIPTDRIDENPFQPRTHYDQDALDALADDIAANGLLQPPPARVVNSEGEPIEVAEFYRTPKLIREYFGEQPDHRVQLAFGHRRFRAVKQLGHGTMPLELSPLTDERMDMMAWSENQKRADLTPLEEAQAIADRIERHDWTQMEAAEELGIGRSTVANKLRLLKLPDAATEALQDGVLSQRQAAALLPLYTLSEAQADAMRCTPEHYEAWPEHLLSWALEQQPSSDEITSAVAGLVERFDWLLELYAEAEAFPQKVVDDEADGLTLNEDYPTLRADEQLMQRIGDTYSARKIQAGKIKSPTEIEGTKYICTGGVSSGSSSYDKADLVELIPQEDWSHPTLTYREQLRQTGAMSGVERFDSDVRRRLFWYGIAVSRGMNKYVLGKPVRVEREEEDRPDDLHGKQMEETHERSPVTGEAEGEAHMPLKHVGRSDKDQSDTPSPRKGQAAAPSGDGMPEEPEVAADDLSSEAEILKEQHTEVIQRLRGHFEALSGSPAIIPFDQALEDEDLMNCLAWAIRIARQEIDRLLVAAKETEGAGPVADRMERSRTQISQALPAVAAEGGQ